MGDAMKNAATTNFRKSLANKLVMPAADAESVWLTLMAHGAKYGVVAAGLGCRDTLRLEAAMPLYGHELNETVDPLTAGLDFAVKFNKSEYPGKAALEVINKAQGEKS